MLLHQQRPISGASSLHKCFASPTFSPQNASKTSLQTNLHSGSSPRTPLQGPLPRLLQPKLHLRSQHVIRAQPDRENEGPVEYNTQFGYSRKDVILIGGGVLVGGLGLYYGLQALGIEAIRAGNYVQIIFVLGLCIAWVASYVFRVSNKDMTYVKQLKTYEDQVMQKRLDEMPESERERMLEEIGVERERREKKRLEKQKLEKR